MMITDLIQNIGILGQAMEVNCLSNLLILGSTRYVENGFFSFSDYSKDNLLHHVLKTNLLVN